MNQSGFYPAYRWWVLAVASLSLLVIQLNVTLYSPLLEVIGKDLAVSPATTEALLSIISLGAVIGFIINGFSTDRYGVMFVVVVGLLCLSVPGVLLPWIGHSFPVVLIARLIQGLSVSIVVTFAAMLAIWFSPKDKPLVLGLLGGALTLGAALGVVLAGPIHKALGAWQTVAAIFAIPGWILLFLSIYIIVAKKPQSFEAAHYFHGEGSNVGLKLREAWSTSPFWVGIALAFFTQWLMLSVWNMTPAFLASSPPAGIGYGPVTAGLFSLAIMIAGVIGPFISGWALMRVFKGNGKPILVVGFLLASIAVCLVPFSFIHGTAIVLLLFLLLAGATATILDPAIAAFVSVNYARRYVGRINGFTLGIGTFGGVVGLGLDQVAIHFTGTIGAALHVVAGGAFLGFLFSIFLKRPKGYEDVERAAILAAAGGAVGVEGSKTN